MFKDLELRKLLYLSLIVIFGVSCWLLSKNYQPSKKHRDFEKDEIPNVTLTNVTMQNYQNGLLGAKLSVPEISHLQSGKKINLKNPSFVIYDKKQQPWTVTAKTAEAKDDGTLVILHEDVKLFQPAGPNNPEITIFTSELTLYPKENRAETSMPVVLHQKAKDNSIAKIECVGVKIFQKTGVIKLLAKTRGYYAANA
jgi:lipopolysaccharide export system protein LptC